MNRSVQSCIVGIGESAVGKVPDRSALQLQADATLAALGDAGAARRYSTA